MRYDIVLGPGAVESYKELDARTRSEVRDAIERHLRHEPTKTSRSRIKRLRGLSRPQYRLRVGEVRIYYDVSGREVQVLGIIRKSDSDKWLNSEGESR